MRHTSPKVYQNYVAGSSGMKLRLMPVPCHHCLGSSTEGLTMFTGSRMPVQFRSVYSRTGAAAPMAVSPSRGPLPRHLQLARRGAEIGFRRKRVKRPYTDITHSRLDPAGVAPVTHLFDRYYETAAAGWCGRLQVRHSSIVTRCALVAAAGGIASANSFLGVPGRHTIFFGSSRRLQLFCRHGAALQLRLTQPGQGPDLGPETCYRRADLVQGWHWQATGTAAPPEDAPSHAACRPLGNRCWAAPNLLRPSLRR